MFASNRIFYDWHSMKPEMEPMNVFGPRSDPERSPDPFMPRHPLVAMEAGDISPVPYMLGYAEKEGIWRANYLLPDPSTEIWEDFVRDVDKGGVQSGPTGFNPRMTEMPGEFIFEVKIQLGHPDTIELVA